jgi:folate-binding protein YgfZ
MESISLQLYQKAKKQAAFYLHPNGGLLKICGDDRVDFLQRQSTNDLRLLQPGIVLQTVLTSPTARILDILSLIQEENALSVLTLPGLGESTTRFLKSKIFFMDKVDVENVSKQQLQLDLVGAELETALMNLGTKHLPDLNQIINFQIGSFEGQLLNLSPSNSPRYRMIVPAFSLEGVLTQMESVGIARLGAAEYNVIRVEDGLPAAGHELKEKCTPLEIGLMDAISTGKGCYTGQEVIARQLTYNKITRQLRGFRLDAKVSLGERIWAGEKRVGVVTSFAVSPEFGPIALGIINKIDTEGASSFLFGEGGDQSVPGRIVQLPFEEDLHKMT